MNIRSRISSYLLPAVGCIALFLSGCAQQRELGWCTVYGAAAGALIGTGAGFGIGEAAGRAHALAADSRCGSGRRNRRSNRRRRRSLLLRSDRAAAASATSAAPSTTAAATSAAMVKEKLVLRGVHFDFNKSKIRPGDAAVLDEAAVDAQGQSRRRYRRERILRRDRRRQLQRGVVGSARGRRRRLPGQRRNLLSAATSARLRQDQFHRDQRYRRRTRAESPRRTAPRTITCIRKAGRSQSRERPALTTDDWRALPVAPASRQNRSQQCERFSDIRIWTAQRDPCRRPASATTWPPSGRCWHGSARGSP